MRSDKIDHNIIDHNNHYKFSGPAVPSLVCEPAALVVTGGDWVTFIHHHCHRRH